MNCPKCQSIIPNMSSVCPFCHTALNMTSGSPAYNTSNSHQGKSTGRKVFVTITSIITVALFVTCVILLFTSGVLDSKNSKEHNGVYSHYDVDANATYTLDVDGEECVYTETYDGDTEPYYIYSGTIEFDGDIVRLNLNSPYIGEYDEEDGIITIENMDFIKE